MNPPAFTKFDDFKKDIRYIGRAILLFAGMEIILNLVLYELVKHTSIPVNDPDYDGLLLCIGSIISLVPSIFYAKNRLHIKWSKKQFEWHFSGTQVINVVCSMYAIAYAVNLLFVMLQNIFQIGFVSNDMFESHTLFNIFFTILGTCIMAPIIEELFCRGIICRSLSKYSSYAAIILTGIFFGMMHMNFQQGLMHMMTGILLAYVSLKYDSILFTIVCHMFYNGIALLISYATNNFFTNVFFGAILITMVIYGFIIIFTNIDAIKKDTTYPYFQIAFRQISVIAVIVIFVLMSLLEIWLNTAFV